MAKNLPDNVIPLRPLTSIARWARPAPASLEQPTNVPEQSQDRYPELWGKVLRLHMQQNSHEADNAYLPFRTIRARAPASLIAVGLAIAGAVIYHIV